MPLPFIATDLYVVDAIAFGIVYSSLQEKLDNRRDEFDTQKTKMKKLEDSWRPSLDQLISKIDSNFSNFMSNLNCAGEVINDG